MFRSEELQALIDTYPDLAQSGIGYLGFYDRFREVFGRLCSLVEGDTEDEMVNRALHHIRALLPLEVVRHIIEFEVGPRLESAGSSSSSSSSSSAGSNMLSVSFRF